jgi:hypothetical protein
MEELGRSGAAVAYRPGLRNEPARAWLAAHAPAPVSAPGEVLLGWDPAACAALLADAPVQITWEVPE